MFEDFNKTLRFLRDTIDNCKSAIYEAVNPDLEDYAERLEEAYGGVYDEYEELKKRYMYLEEEIKSMEHEIMCMKKIK